MAENFLKISKHREETNFDPIPILIDFDQRRFFCCDKSHILSKPLSKSKCYPVNKNLQPKSKQENQNRLCHRHGRFNYKLNFDYINDEYIFEKGNFAVIYHNETIRHFKKIDLLFSYLYAKKFLDKSSLNEFEKYNYLRRDLLLEDEKRIDLEASPVQQQNRVLVTSKSTEKLLQLPVDSFDQKYKPKKVMSREDMVKLQNRRLKDTRYFLRIANFERLRLQGKLEIIENQREG